MAEKTEQPTSKRLRDAREEGQVAHSKDFTQAALVLSWLGWLIVNGQAMGRHIGNIMLAPTDALTLPFPIALGTIWNTLLREGILLLVPFLIMPLLVGLGAEVAQVGVALSPKALVPSGKRLDVVSNAKNIFSKKNLFELVKSTLKIAVLAWILVLVIKHNLADLMGLPGLDIAGGGEVFRRLITYLALALTPVYLLFAGADFGWQQFQHRKQLMMSREEVTRENKDSEGDHQIKSRRKELHRELAGDEDVERSAGASALVVNPTHVAVALYYDALRTPLPLVWAKGRDGHALQMIGAARMAGIPVLRDVNLAWALYEHGEKNQYIPEELIGPVAEIIRAINEIKVEKNR